MLHLRVLLSRASLALLMALSLQLSAPAPLAADMGVPTPRFSVPTGQSGVANADEALQAHLRRHAVLLMIRASFDVIPHDQVPDELVAEARRIGAHGPADHDLAQLDQDLLAEGSYYLVSLRYLASLGGAVWPSDRPEKFYVNDALVRLESLQRRLMEAVQTRADPLPILTEAQVIYALTEGLAEVPDELDHFGRRDDLVDQVLAADGPRTST